MARYAVVDAIEERANETVIYQLATLGAGELTERESLLVALGIRAGIGAVKSVTEDRHG